MLELAALDRFLQDIAARLYQLLESRREKPLHAQRLLTVSEAAVYLGRSENAIKLLIHRGKLPVTRLDSKTQLDRNALDKLIHDCTAFET